MALKIILLLAILVTLTLAGRRVLRSRIRNYDPLTWGIVEFFWYMISFVAVCVGLIEIDRIERQNDYLDLEKQLYAEHQNIKALLYAQTRLLPPQNAPASQRDGVEWFFKMYTLLEEGVQSPRWESFLKYTRVCVFHEPGIYADRRVNMMEFNWPSNTETDPSEIYLKDEIAWMVENLKALQRKKQELNDVRPVENTNYIVRYILIGLYLLGLSLKILKIHADYKRARRG